VQQEDPALKFLSNEKAVRPRTRKKGRRKEGHGHA
jgi:hypothetical protein